MARGINTYKLGAGFNITGQEPIDSRFVVDSTADLWGYEKGSNSDPWKSADGKSNVLYEGLVVAIKTTGQLYVLKDRANYNTESAWATVGGDVSANISALTARIDVLDKLDALQKTSGLEVATDGSLKIKLDPATDNALSITDKGIKAVGAEYELVAVTHVDEYGNTLSSIASTYEFRKNGVVLSKINIPKDQFLKSAKFIIADYENANAWGLVEGDPYLQFVFNLPEDDVIPVHVPVSELVDTYTQGDYITIDNNRVSVNYNTLKARLDGDLKVRNVDTTAVNGIALTLTDPGTGENAGTVGITVDLDTLAKDIKAKIVSESNDVVLSAKIGNLDPDVDENKPTVQDALEYLEDQITTMAAGGITDITTTKAVGEADPKLIITKEDDSTTVNIDVNVGALISNVSNNMIKLNGGKLYAQMNWEVL